MKFFEILLSPHLVWAGFFLFLIFRFKENFSKLFEAITDRISSIQDYKKTKGGHEVTFSATQTSKDEKILPNISEIPPTGIAENDEDSIWEEDRINDVSELRKHVKSERGIRYLWEYRYLNYFLARHTQEVLDWFAVRDNPITFNMFDAFWMDAIQGQKERDLLLEALTGHHLILLKAGFLEITSKGKEYQEWRGSLPPLSTEKPEPETKVSFF